MGWDTFGGPAGASEGTGGPERWGDARAATTPEAPRWAPAGGGPQWPEAPPSKSQRTSFIVLAVVLIFVSFVAGIAFLGFGRDWNETPKAWDPQVAPIAARVAALRGLQFKHAVKVNYLTKADFEGKVTSSPEDLKKQREQIQQVEALLRATGLLGGTVNLGDAVNTSQGADVLAFYSDETKQVYIRGTGPLTVETRATLAHELTHVLQDQYFDIAKLRKAADKSTSGSSDALTALIEGDAERIRVKYLHELPASEQRAYDRLSDKTSGEAQSRTKDVPAVIEASQGAPYIFGPAVIGMLDSAGGNGTINAALTGAPPSTRIYFDPSAVNDTPDSPPEPKLQPDEKKVTSFGDDSGFDAYLMYLMLASRLDRPEALRGIDGYSTGSSVAYTKNDTLCFRATVVGRNASSTKYIASLVQRWAAMMPSANVEAITPNVTFHSCDPGQKATAPANKTVEQAVTFAASRDALATVFVREKLSTKTAVCAVRLLFQQPDFAELVLSGGSLANPTSQMLNESRAAGQTCARNNNAGRP